ncbi:ShlB/FhaC/HecB family hemolysin secretion/activation protein [Sphingomonas cavernae]|uniref:ShlB/FhaC/HecB family hemolysin secretion/activation protein n=1 Tax=Sphingomonas cavernae TaxID=2320861 RepID=A0A418WUK0_9SPHN|nr:ShlB/FhaC/HecB family hemolysin secretion/activation protein [Sphingomonas cavernae]RJF96383.1 ShlB/FhaC/HecB family hemolysin secretion/activation protein [Sphingomonas cavernae]
MKRAHPMPRSMRCAVLIMLGVLLPVAANAQDFERVQPKLPPQPATPPVEVPPEAAPVEGDTRVLVPELRGLVFVDGMGRLQAGGVAPETVSDGIGVREAPLLSDPDFAAKLRPYIGPPLTQADLDAIGHLVRETYRAKEHPFVHVSVPPQNVENGIVQVVITEYRVGEVTVTGNRHFSTELIRDFGDLKSGEVLTTPRLREALEDYNQNPFLTVSAIAKPGRETGLTDIELQAQDRAPWRVYAGYDNQGVPTLDRDEWYVGFNWGNVAGTGQILSYQFTRAFNGRYESHSASYVVPIDAYNRVLFFGAYATQTPRLAPIFRSRGHSGQVSMRWSSDLPLWGGLKQRLQAGFDFKRTDSNLEFARFRILDNAVGIFQFPVIYTASLPDSHGETVAENLLVISPGNITHNNNDAAFRLLVPGSDATYVYDRISLTRTTTLPHGMSWIARGLVQVASDNLPYSEQIGGGGIGSVRGYDTNTALGSEGLVLTTELRSPAFSLIGNFGKGQAISDQMQVGVFIDYAWLRQRNRIPDLRRSEELASVGVNLHYTVDHYLDLQVEVGTQLNRPSFARDKDTQAAIVATISF